MLLRVLYHDFAPWMFQQLLAKPRHALLVSRHGVDASALRPTAWCGESAFGPPVLHWLLRNLRQIISIILHLKTSTLSKHCSGMMFKKLQQQSVYPLSVLKHLVSAR